MMSCRQCKERVGWDELANPNVFAKLENLLGFAGLIPTYGAVNLVKFYTIGFVLRQKPLNFCLVVNQYVQDKTVLCVTNFDPNYFWRRAF